MLNKDTLAALRAPFPASAVKWKIEGNPKNGDMALVVAFIDARDVAERLDAVTGGDWSDDYGSPVVNVEGFISVECCLTVCGVTRKDVGTFRLSDKEERNEDAVKAVYSDAFKRASVKFGVNAPMYQFPTVRAKAMQSGWGWTLTDESKRELAVLAGVLSTSEALPKFQSLFIVGQQQSQPQPTKPAVASFAPKAQTERPNLLVEPPPPKLAPAPPTRQPRPEQQPAATEAQRQRIAREVVNNRAAALAVNGVGDKFGVPNLHQRRSPAHLKDVELSLTQASNLISALAELNQRVSRAA